MVWGWLRQSPYTSLILKCNAKPELLGSSRADDTPDPEQNWYTATRRHSQSGKHASKTTSQASVNQKRLISLYANQKSLSASVWRFSKNDSDTSRVESFDKKRDSSRVITGNCWTWLESCRVIDSSHDITAYMTQCPSLFTLISYCAIAFSFALMFANGWFTACDDCYDASACRLSHMKQ